MPSFSWRDSYSIGHADIDAEHQQLFRLANAFFETVDKASKMDCAMRLFRYTREHFDHEEALMREIDYPAMSVHIDQHNALISGLNDVAASIAKDTLQSEQLKKFLTSWLVGHIVTFDTKLSAYIKFKVPGPDL
jgi:hemerythrin